MALYSKYVDLDLPSRTLWEIENVDGYFNKEAAEEFGDQLPAEEQFRELIQYTTQTWDNYHNGMLFCSKRNARSLFFPAEGCYTEEAGVQFLNNGGYYWGKDGVYLCIEEGFVTVRRIHDDYCNCIRTVNKKQG